jgi:hypothetical protein
MGILLDKSSNFFYQGISYLPALSIYRRLLVGCPFIYYHDSMPQHGKYFEYK